MGYVLDGELDDGLRTWFVNLFYGIWSEAIVWLILIRIMIMA